MIKDQMRFRDHKIGVVDICHFAQASKVEVKGRMSLADRHALRILPGS